MEPGVAQAAYDRLGIGIPYHVQLFFARIADHARVQDRHMVTVADVETVYRQQLLGPEGQSGLLHYETRLRQVLDEDVDYAIAMTILAETARRDEFAGASRQQVVARFSKLVSDANERVDTILNILNMTGIWNTTWTGGCSSFRPAGSGTIGASGTARPDHCIQAEVAEEYGMSQPTSAPTIRKFNPGVFQSDQEVVEQFVVRHKALDAALAVVKRNLVSESCQHALIVAPRGMGKTMLLARMEAELRLDSDLASNLIPVRLMEESYEVVDLTGFWLEVLFQLGRECSRLGLDAGAELEAAHASFCARWRDTHVRLDVLAALERGLASIGRRMVLMVENLQALSETWHSDDEWGLRRVLQTESMIMLMGTATTRFKSLEDADRAFFDLFRLIELGPLTTKECAALWNMATRQNLAAREIRPFEILTGGSPRLLVLLAGVGHQLTLKQLLAGMVGLIDEHTEYFRQCLDSLPAGERRVFLALADLWEPALASAIADRARMDIRTTSVMLRRLTDRGAVSASATRRSRRYSVIERMFCFYYSLRRERNQPAVIRRFIAFMVAFYDPSAATKVFADLDDGSDVGRVIREQLLQAIVDQDAAYRWVEQWDVEIKMQTLHSLWADVLQDMERAVDQCGDEGFADESRLVGLSHRLRQIPHTELRPIESIRLHSFVAKNQSKIPPLAIIALCQTCLDLRGPELIPHDKGYRSWVAYNQGE